MRKFTTGYILGLFTQDVINDIVAHNYEPFSIAEDVAKWLNNPYTDVVSEFKDRQPITRFDNRMRWVKMIYVDYENPENAKIINIDFHVDEGKTYAKIPAEFGLSLGKSC